MAEQKNTETRQINPAEISSAMTRIAERSQRLVTDFISRQASEPTAAASLDPLNIGNAFLQMTTRLMSDPAKMVEAQMSLWQDYMSLWQTTSRRMLGQQSEPVVAPESGDRRFKDEMWTDNEVFDYIKQSYLLSARWMQGVVRGVDGLDDHTAQKVEFYTRQFVDAMAPSNFVLTNPEVLRATIESGGENLLKGLDNLLGDLERGKGNLAIRMTDYDAFRVGDNIAVTPGKVVYQNDLMQLIQYTPSTPTAFETPLLVVPPWINKFYILDLRPKNSYIKWAVDQGHTVFVISWVNPDERLGGKTFGDYMKEGPLAALDAIEKATGQRKANLVGYCLGGTLTACTLAWMTAKGDDRIASATLLTTMTDFKEPGELGVFIDEEQLMSLEEPMAETGFLDGRDTAPTFNIPRANDLIWSFVVNNYLLGKDPFPFDLLYWNSDSTRMPAAMHSFYLRKMYQENKLIEPGGIEIDGVPIDLTSIRTPVYMLSTREDHIAPWTSTFSLTRLLAGPVRFVLSASGHIAGVVNPPAANKYCYWVNTKKAKTPEAWLSGAAQTDGSWWSDWQKWVEKTAGAQVPVREPGDGALAPIEDAPGAYVKVRAV
jgi:polyhydroxyalkanoate synthase